MSRRSRVPDSLRWRAVVWMEMGLSQADAARRLNVSRSVVQRLWDQYQSEDSVSRRHVSGQPRVTTPVEDRFLALSARRRGSTTVLQLVADHFVSIREKNLRYHGAKTPSQCRFPCKATSCVSPQRTTENGPLCWAREYISWTRQQWASVLFTDEFRFTLESDSGRLLIWRE
ncbi:hypothetical protein AVEN_255781-1 [Araneus ventricosus]|uniref:Paired domain-containing protein n=1 Tax=Araneus ventricosus TaxID=182803 RepID=A0A4Y2UWK5_ARAVE|nr:hypothetical protein AVEN_255781-1 [Araneus ventricosus]